MTAIGIDLGTTYSCVGVFQNDRVEIIANDQGNRTTPSYVSFTETERIIGDGAKSASTQNPLNTVYDAKRLIGREFNDPSLQRDMKTLSYDVVNSNGKPKIKLLGTTAKKASAILKRKKFSIYLSLSDDYPFAIATVILTK